MIFTQTAISTEPLPVNIDSLQLKVEKLPLEKLQPIAPSKVRRSLFVVPTFAFSPETNFGFGIAGGYYFPFSDPVRISSIAYSATYTLNNQFLFNVGPRLYFGAKKNWYLQSTVGFQRYPDYFYGLGNKRENLLEKQIAYVSRNIYLNLQPQYYFTRTWSVGLNLAFRYEELEDGFSMPAKFDHLLGVDPYFMWGIGGLITYDTRDNMFYPSEGMFFKTTALYFEPSLGSSSRALKSTIDFRHFVGLGKGFVFAYQVYSDISAGKLPFQMMPTLGGRELGRGFKQGRFKDDFLVALQSEFRIPIFWRIKLAAFANIGDVYNWQEPQWATPKVGYGLGLRVRLNKAKVNFRVDLAHNNFNEWSFYIVASEAF